MRKPKVIQSEIFEINELKFNNYTFLNYINKLLKDHMPYEDFDFDYDDFIIPGRIEISIDGKTAFIDAQSDILIALYKIIRLRTDIIEEKIEEGLEDEVDLQTYENY